MRKIILIITLLILACSCKNTPYKEKIYYRNLHELWDGKYIRDPLGEYKDWFEKKYRRPFDKRNLDDDYILCYFMSIEDTLPATDNYLKVDSTAKILLMKVKVLDVFLSPENPFLQNTFNENLLEEEYLGKDYGVKNYLIQIKSENHSYSLARKLKYIKLVVREQEIKTIKQNVDKMSLNLCYFEPREENNKFLYDTVLTDVFYSYNQYDLSKLCPFDKWIRHCDSIDQKIRKKLNLDEDSISH